MSHNLPNFGYVMNDVAATLKGDPHHRLLSWDHSWEHWNSFTSRENGDESIDAFERAALHLAFYLASWGMYRGSTDLLQRDYKVLLPAVYFLRDETRRGIWQDCIFKDRDSNELIEELKNLADNLTDVLKPKLARPDKDEDKVNISDTLLSKIMINTLGCVPAFDVQVKDALCDILNGDYTRGNGFTCKRLNATIELARDNREIVQEGRDLLKRELQRDYPLTKVFDIFLWHHGFSLPHK